MVVVLDEVGCKRVALLGLAPVPIGVMFAATHPERTTALVLVNATARVQRGESIMKVPLSWRSANECAP